MTSRMSEFVKQDIKKNKSLIQDMRSDSPESSCVSMQSDEPKKLPDYTTDLRLQKKKSKTIEESELEDIFKGPEHTGDLKITQDLKNIQHTDLGNTLQNKLVSVCQQKLKSKLKHKYKTITEGISLHGRSADLNEIYTDLNITEGWSGNFNNEHEVIQIETVTRILAKQTPIKCNDLFRDTPIRSVLTGGVAGIGKTISVQKFILDWAEGKANQDVIFMFPLHFRELNLMTQKKLSMMDLLHQFFSEIKDLQSLNCEVHKVVFIFDGLDECRLPLNFQDNERLCHVTESASVDVLMTNIIRRNLLSSAHLWITSRPGAASLIPPEYINQVTEVQGFSDPQKEKYFRKKISDQSLANKIITHMKSLRSLYNMCQIPVFCWISATVLEKEAQNGELPKTLTQMFIHFLIFQIKRKYQKYHQKYDPDPQQTTESIQLLGNLAFQKMEKKKLIFYEKDLTDCYIDIKEATVYSGLCTRIFSEELEFCLGKVFSFVHVSIQEFLAALYTFKSFINKKSFFTKSNMSAFLRSAVKKALQSENGHLNLFLPFLLGLSLESNQKLLREVVPQVGISSHSKRKIIKYIKRKIRKNPSPEKSINLFLCLYELNDHSLVQEVQPYLTKVGDWCLSGVRLSCTQWSALLFLLLNSGDNLDEFYLNKYDRSEKCLLKLLPVVKASRKAVLCGCDLTEESCRDLSSVLSSNSSSLRELDLSGNNLKDSGVELLSAGLEKPQCKLEILRLCGCNLTEESCKVLSSVLSSKSSSLRELQLSRNHLHDSDVKLLSDLQKDPQCKLEILSWEDLPLPSSEKTTSEELVHNKLTATQNPDTVQGQSGDTEVFSPGLASSSCGVDKNQTESAVADCSDGCKGEAISPQTPKTDLHFVDKHIERLVQDVCTVMEIADGLLSRKMITKEQYYKVKDESPSQEQMRTIYKYLNAKAKKEAFYEILKDKEPHLVEELENESNVVRKT